MRLKNKKTGEIIDFDSFTDLCFGSKIQLQATDIHDKPIYIYNSLAELNEEWEDALEESKKYWFIDPSGDVTPFWEEYETPEATKECKQIGNYFETKEEAEKAVEKLKVLKRLKDKDCEIVGYRFSPLPEEFLDGKHIWCNTTGRFTIEVNYPLDKSDTIRNNLDLLFGGEE